MLSLTTVKQSKCVQRDATPLTNGREYNTINTVFYCVAHPDQETRLVSQQKCEQKLKSTIPTNV